MSDNGNELKEFRKEIEFYRKIAENVPGIVFLVNADSGTVPYACGRLEETFGVTPGELEDDASALLEFLEHPDRTEVLERIRRAAAAEKPLDLTASVSTAKKPSYYRITASPVREDGELFYAGVALDVTEKEQYRVTLEETNNELQKICENVAEAVFLIGPEHRVIATACNRVIKEMFGYDPEELVGETTEKLHVGEEMFREFGRISEAELDEKGHFETEWRMQRKDGTIINTYNVVSALDEDKGWERGVVSVVRDITDRKKAEEQLRRSEERYRSLVEDSPWLVCCHRPTSEITFVNETYCRYFGKTRQELIGTNFLDLLPEGERNKVRENLNELGPESPTQSHEHRVITSRGEVRWQRWTNRAMCDEDGNIVLYQAIGEDITDRKRDEQLKLRLNSLLRAVRAVRELRVEEEDPEQLVQRSCDILQKAHECENVWVVTFDEEGDLRYSGCAGDTGSFGRLLDMIENGRKPTCVSNALMEPGVALPVDAEQDCPECPMRGICGRHGLVCAFERSKRASGVLRVTRTSGRDWDREEKELIAEIASDLGNGLQRVETQKRLRLRDRAIETSVTGISFLDMDATLVSANPAAVDMWGYEDESKIVGRKAWDFCQSAEKAKNAFRTAKEEGQWSGELQARRKDGSTFPMLASVSLVRDRDGTPTHVLGAFLDITERKRAAREREHLLEELRDSNRRLEETLDELRETERQLIDQERHRALTQMASGIAHDFNNYLGVIRGSAQLLLGSPDKMDDREKVETYVSRIDKEAEKATETVKRMRKFYKPGDHLPRKPVDLNRCIEEAIDSTAPRWREEASAQGAHIRVEKDLASPTNILGNEAEIHELLTNLIFNAVDAMPGGGTLRLATWQATDELVALEVSDTGVGMSEETRQQCLDPFFTTKGSEGSGLGLSTVQGIVERQEGTMEIETEQGVGTTFRIQLPAAAFREGEMEEHLESPPAVETQSILIVEDDETQRVLLRKHLRDQGHTVNIARNGQEALEMFETGTHSLVITDRAMPEMSGDEVARAIRDRAPEVPIIMLTGFGEMMKAAGEYPGEVDELLSKPVNAEELQTALAKCCADKEN